MAKIFKDSYERPLHWQVIDKIHYADGRVEEREYYNTVVNDCSRLIACLMAGAQGYAGIKYWAVGSGESNWSNTSLPIPDITNTSLVNETYRKAITPENITFIDADNKPTSEVTNKLQVSVTFNEDEANGELREFALFGGKATDSLNSGLMVNHKIHPIIFKTDGMILERLIRLTF